MKPREYPVFDEIDYTDLDVKVYPKLPDLSEDVGRQHARWAVGPEEPLTSTATQDQMDDWWQMAERAHAARGIATGIQDLMSSRFDPVECECGKPYYNSEDYMCPACREAMDASL